MVSLNTLVTNVALCLVFCSSQIMTLRMIDNTADFPKSTNDPRLVELQKSLVWQYRFADEITRGITLFTNLIQANILSDLRKEYSNEGVKENLMKNLTGRYDKFNAQTKSIIKNCVSTLTLGKDKFAADFASTGKIRFYLSKKDIGTDSEQIEENKFTPWFDFDSKGTINIYGWHKTLHEFVKELYKAKGFSLKDFDPAYVYFESTGDIDFTPAPRDHFPFISFGYIALKSLLSNAHGYTQWTTVDNDPHGKYNFTSSGYIGFGKSDLPRLSKLSKDLVLSGHSMNTVWYSFVSGGIMNMITDY